MTKLPVSFDTIAHEIQTLLDEGMRPAAIKRLTAILDGGTASPQVQRITSTLLAPATGARGRPRKTPARWYDIGIEYDALEAQGSTYEFACQSLAQSFGQSERTIERTLAYYRGAVEASRQ